VVEVKSWIVAGVTALIVALGAAPGASAHAHVGPASPLAAAPATPPVWSLQSNLQVVRPNGLLWGVSCTEPAACVAAGDTVNVAGLLSPLAEQWDGVQWTSMTIPRPSGSTYAILQGVSCASSLNCEAVGRYGDSAGDELPFAEGWNGSVWTIQYVPFLFGNSQTALIRVSCSSGTGGCEAFGWSNPSGDQTLVERWDGSAWTRQTLPLPSGDDASLDDVSCAPDGTCEIVGAYESGPSATHLLAARWDGSQFSLQSPAPAPGDNEPVGFTGVSCLSGGVCEVTGAVAQQGSFAERLSGGTWTVQTIPGPSSRQLPSVSCLSTGQCEAVGNDGGGSGATPVAVRFDGTSWGAQALSAVSNTAVWGVSCTSASACTTVGSHVGGSLAERWDGATWSTQTTADPTGYPNQQLSALSCFSSTSCTSVGSDQAASGNTEGLIRHWNGTNWVAQTSVNPASTTRLTGVACPSSTTCEAVGNTPDPSDPSSSIPLIERGTGAAWSRQTAPLPRGYDHVHLDSVACTATSTCWAVGTAYASGKPRVALETWNGTSWNASTLPTPGGSTVVQSMSIACPSTGCLVTGDFEAGNTMLRPFAIRYDGTQWAYVAVPLPSNSTNSQLAAIACTSTTACTAVGSYATKASATLDLPLAESWDGATWTIHPIELPSGAAGAALRGISCLGTSCHAVGLIQSSSETPQPSIPLAESWNGSTWSQQTTATLNQGYTAELDAVSCTAAATCEAAGNYAGRGGGSLSLIETGG
jgi:hypothetical protein